MADNSYPYVAVRVSEEERTAIEDEAKHEHMPMSTMIRSIVMKEINRRRQVRESSRIPQAA